jgi:hypothetical protein
VNQDKSRINNTFENISIGIIMIATNEYLDLWKLTVLDLDQFAFKYNSKKSIHLFTNKVTEAENWAIVNLKNYDLFCYYIKGWGWPEATLLRYKFITSLPKNALEEVLIYLDSDMHITGDFGPDLLTEISSDSIFVVDHPGYVVGRNGILKFLSFLKAPRLIGSLLAKYVSKSKGMGDWETNEISTAYVKPDKRFRYVHGAIWGGYKEALFKMCNTLAINVDIDLNTNYIAKWHDESHLNWFTSENEVTYLSNRFSNFSEYKNLNHINSYIYTRIKPKYFGRTSTQSEI